jgi:kynurenine formamidase
MTDPTLPHASARAGNRQSGPSPTFSELQARTDGAPAGASWGVFGADDEIGTINLLDDTRVLAGAREIVLGEVHSLNWQIDFPRRNTYRRTPKRVHLGAGNTFGRDDYIERFFLQYSSQWDGLRHIISSDQRFYNGVDAAIVDAEGSATLGIQLWAQRGIAGRGVLLDVALHCQLAGTPVDPATNFAIDTALLDATAAAQRVTVERGDVLLIRTGWTGWYMTLDADEQAAAVTDEAMQPGLASGRETAAWLWDHGVAATAADNMALEAVPIDEGPDSLHRLLIPGLGMPIGEYFWLDGLAAACARDQRWTFMFTSAPLNIVGGVGSPPNALALR